MAADIKVDILKQFFSYCFQLTTLAYIRISGLLSWKKNKTFRTFLKSSRLEKKAVNLFC